jgi:hypothetical protein
MQYSFRELREIWGKLLPFQKEELKDRGVESYKEFVSKDRRDEVSLLYYYLQRERNWPRAKSPWWEYPWRFLEWLVRLFVTVLRSILRGLWWGIERLVTAPITTEEEDETTETTESAWGSIPWWFKAIVVGLIVFTLFGCMGSLGVFLLISPEMHRRAGDAKILQWIFITVGHAYGYLP